MMRALTLALALTAACGSKTSAPATTPAATDHAAMTGMDHHEEMATMLPEIAKFHDVIAPRWHAEKGPLRMKDTCAALPDLQSSADAIAKATPPITANADKWTTGTRALVASITTLDASCKSNDATGFETAFAKVHDSFHGLMAQAGGHGEDHEEGMEHGMKQGEHKM